MLPGGRGVWHLFCGGVQRALYIFNLEQPDSEQPCIVTMRRSCSLQENGLCLSILKRRCPLGQLCLGFGQSRHLQGFPPVPVSSWPSRQEVRRSSCVGGVLRCRLCLEVEDVVLLFCLS